MEKAKKLYEELTERKNGLIEVLNDEKKELTEIIISGDYKKILNLSNYTSYVKVMTMAKEIEEIDIKLRTIRAIIE